jgi:hypothetical protein
LSRFMLSPLPDQIICKSRNEDCYCYTACIIVRLPHISESEKCYAPPPNNNLRHPRTRTTDNLNFPMLMTTDFIRFTYQVHLYMLQHWTLDLKFHQSSHEFIHPHSPYPNLACIENLIMKTKLLRCFLLPDPCFCVAVTTVDACIPQSHEHFRRRSQFMAKMVLLFLKVKICTPDP